MGTRPAWRRGAAAGGTAPLNPVSKIDGGLDINPVGVGGAADAGEGLFDVFADKKMAVASLDLGEAREGVAGDQCQFAADKTVVTRMNAIAAGGPPRAADR